MEKHVVSKRLMVHGTDDYFFGFDVDARTHAQTITAGKENEPYHISTPRHNIFSTL